ncbi:MAG: NAD-dependent epimerase/dehydratase family protein [Dehalococcoidia bacterium]
MNKAFWQDKIVFITGANGYLGTKLAEQLLGLGAQVNAYDLTAESGLSKSRLASKVSIFLGDLAEIDRVQDLLQKVNAQICFHLAGQSEVAKCQETPAKAFNYNVEATWSFLEACRRYGKAQAIVTVSSNHIYGNQELRPTSETAPLNGKDVYAVSKLCADLIAQCYAKNYDMPITIARITNTFGGYDPHDEHVVTSTIRAALVGQRPVIKSNGRPSKGYLYIDDTVAAFLVLAEQTVLQRLSGDCFNFAPEENINVLDLANRILQIIGRSDLEPAVLGHSMELYEIEHLSIQKAQEVLGWEPRFSLDDGLRLAIQEMKERSG